jgi:hypothetical protein
MVTSAEFKQKYCDRVAYFRGDDVALAITRKARPADNRGRDVWFLVSSKINEENINADDYLDWCFKEAIPGLPFLNTLLSSLTTFVQMGSPVTIRKDVALHVKLMLNRFKSLLNPADGITPALPKDVLFDPRYEFHPVFAVEMADKLEVPVAEDRRELASKITDTMPYYFHEMQTLLKDWVN